MSKKRLSDRGSVKKLLFRSNEQPLTVLVLGLQAVCMLLLTFRGGSFRFSALLMAAVIPAAAYTVLKLISDKWHADRVLYLLTVFLAGLGIILLSALYPANDRAVTQCLYLGAGYVAMMLGIVIARHFSGSERILKLAAFCSLGFACLPFAFPAGGSARIWVRMGGMQFQPAELLKPVTVFILSAFFAVGGRSARRAFWGAAYGAAMCGILVLQKDLGGVCLYFLTTAALFAAGTHRRKITLIGLAVTAVLAVILITQIDKFPRFNYAAERIDIWKDPWNSTSENAPQIQQGLISIASGGLVGSGLSLSYARKVAVVASDYIFAALSEEFGVLFSLSVIAVYLVILLRGIWTACCARSKFSALVCFGCVFELTVQMLLIVPGNLNIIPLTGVTLPFISEGGSSLTACMMMMGLILGVSSLNAEDEADALQKLPAAKGARR